MYIHVHEHVHSYDYVHVHVHACFVHVCCVDECIRCTVQLHFMHVHVQCIVLWLTCVSCTQPDRVLERAWGVLHATSSKGPLLSFYQDNHKELRVLRREKIELLTVRMVTRILDNPKHSNCFTLKIKGKRNRTLFDCDSKWVPCICLYIYMYRYM